MEDKKLIQQMELALHGLLRAMNLERLPVQREGGVFSPKNLSLMEMRILRSIDEHGEMLLRDIRAEVELPNSTLTSIIKKFENKELIQRRIDAADRRSYVLSITDKGHLFNLAHRSIDHLMAEEAIRRIGDPEAAEAFIRTVELFARSPLFSVEDFVKWQDAIAKAYKK